MKHPLQWKAWEIGDILRHAEGMSTALTAYFRAIDGEGDPKAIRAAVENLRTAHREFEQAKGG
jgi:hypothetical protein